LRGYIVRLSRRNAGSTEAAGLVGFAAASPSLDEEHDRSGEAAAARTSLDSDEPEARLLQVNCM
jgi:hypothetical protein